MAEHYAEAFSTEKGRCYRFISGGDFVGPTHCHEQPTVTGTLVNKAGRRFAVHSCGGHSADLVNVRNLESGNS